MAGLIEHDGIDDDLEQDANEPSAGVGRSRGPWPIRIWEEAGEEVEEDANMRGLAAVISFQEGETRDREAE